jgi:WD40-like Beta Propeller Repeat
MSAVMRTTSAMKRVAMSTLVLGIVVAQRSACAVGPVIALERISIATDGTQGNGDSSQPVISTDGRVVAFESDANSLVPGFASSAPGAIFVRDRAKGTTELISGGLGGALQLGSSFTPAISADGRFVAFNSTATNLIPGGTTGTQIFVHDRQLGTNVLASGNDGGTDTAGGGTSELDDTIPHWMSGDGRYVVFHGYAKLTPNATNDHVHLYRRDLVAGRTELVDVNPSGVNASGDSDGGSISTDGRFILFVSYANDVVGTSPYFVANLYLRDMVLGTTISITPNLSTSGLCLGESGDPPVYNLSANARFAAFYSTCPDIAAGQDPNDYIFARDLSLGVTSPLRLNDDGTPGASGTYVSIADSGRYVVFWSQATTIITGATHLGDIYMRDRSAARTYRLSQRVDTGAAANGANGWPVPSNNGYIVFTTYANNLVDGDTNGYSDVVVATLDSLFASGFE